MARQKSHTKQITTRLDLSKADELEIYNSVVAWKAQRRFSPMLRNALRLVADLEAGNTDVLIELYPAVGRLLASEYRNDDVLELARAVKSLADSVSLSEAARQRSATLGQHGGGALPRNTRAAPHDALDASDLMVTAAKGEKGKAADNLAKGLMGFSL